MRLIKIKRAIAYSGTLVAVLLVVDIYIVGGRILISIFPEIRLSSKNASSNIPACR